MFEKVLQLERFLNTSNKQQVTSSKTDGLRTRQPIEGTPFEGSWTYFQRLYRTPSPKYWYDQAHLSFTVQLPQSGLVRNVDL